MGKQNEVATSCSLQIMHEDGLCEGRLCQVLHQTLHKAGTRNQQRWGKSSLLRSSSLRILDELKSIWEKGLTDPMKIPATICFDPTLLDEGQVGI
jgi:hypothetical protein